VDREENSVWKKNIILYLFLQENLQDTNSIYELRNSGPYLPEDYQDFDKK